MVHQQKEKQCGFVNQILQDVNHLEQDTTATIQDQEQKQGIGLVVIGSFFISIIKPYN